MRTPTPRSIVLVTLLLVAGAATAAAQAPQGATTPGCRGNSYSSDMDDLTGLPSTYPTIAAVQPGSPAAIAGVQPGDSIVAVNGIETLAYDPDRDRPRAPGDTVALTLRRGSSDIAARIVLGRRDAPVPPEEIGLCRPIRKP